MRAMLRNVIDPATGQTVSRLVSWYQRTIYSSWTMATGNTAYAFFQNTEAANLRNYNYSQNPFISNQGRILSIRAEFLAAAFGQIQVARTGGAAILTAINQLRTQLQLTITKNSEPCAVMLLADLMPVLPMVSIAQGSDDSAFAFPLNTDTGGGLYKATDKNLVIFDPPLEIQKSEVLTINAALPSGVSVPAALNGLILNLYMLLEEIPPLGTTPVRQ